MPYTVYYSSRRQGGKSPEKFIAFLLERGRQSEWEGGEGDGEREFQAVSTLLTEPMWGSVSRP